MKKTYIYIVGFSALVSVVLLAVFTATPPNGSAPGNGETVYGDTSGKQPDISRYDDPDFRFSFVPPAGYFVTASPVTSIDEGETKTISVERSGVPDDNIQIVIVPFSEYGTSITPARIMKDIPGLRVTNAREYAAPGGVAIGLVFSTEDSAVGPASREAWFEKGGDLFQISTSARNAALLDGLLATLVFN